jgi:hypothetical protein
MASRKKWDFFIAHSGPDQQHAEKLYELLVARSRPFVDSKSLQLGDDWDVVLRDAQRDSAVTVVLISENSDSAFYQREEVATAIGLSRADPLAVRVVPVYLNGFPSISDTAPYGLRIKHGIAISENVSMGDVAERLLQLLAELRQEEVRAEVAPISSDGHRLELCVCIDTGGNILDGEHERRVLREAWSLPSQMAAVMATKDKSLESIRVRIVTFEAEVRRQRIGVEIETDFQEHADVARQFQDVLAMGHDLSKALMVEGGALAGLARALESQWTESDNGKMRHVIAVWSDTIPSRDDAAVDKLYRTWNEMNRRTKRLLVYAPECEFWDYLTSNWENTLWFPSEAGKGLESWELDEILATISNSL